ncbi:MAG: serine/threonine protein phosphatase [Cyanobacteria bacterium SBLK]|nr:serine/threonine protein phosphatase [Cyanobacteria bacterium SBLK]
MTSGRAIAIGDIHGCSRAFDLLLDAIALQPEDTLITLGDYIDRGNDSKGIIDRLISLSQQGHLIPLKGNHEIMMLEARQSQYEEQHWLKSGGEATLQSYVTVGQTATLEHIPIEHWWFMEKTCHHFWETETHFFVHANVDPNIPLNAQTESMLFWEKLRASVSHYSGKIMVCGHTSQKNGNPINFGSAICIDTRVYDTGWLTGFDVNSGRIWQANQNGQKRSAWIDEFRV